MTIVFASAHFPSRNFSREAMSADVASLEAKQIHVASPGVHAVAASFVCAGIPSKRMSPRCDRRFFGGEDETLYRTRCTWASRDLRIRPRPRDELPLAASQTIAHPPGFELEHCDEHLHSAAV